MGTPSSMSRLTLYWHLRGIVEGVTNPECVRVDLKTYFGGRWWPETRYYTDPTVEGYRQYESTAKADSYTAPFDQDCGEFCDALSIRAYKALHADDTVQYLDNVAHDPTKRFQERGDAAQLLSWHIYPDAPRVRNDFEVLERDDIDPSEWDRRTNYTPLCLPMECVNDDCTEGECLADPNTLRDEDRAVCMVCGTEQPMPMYP